VCPHPPLLIPDVGADEVVDARQPALDAVRWLVGFDPDLVVVVGAGPETASYGSGDSGSLAAYGVELAVPLGPRICAGAPVLPLSLTVGAWLLRESGWTGDRQGYAVAPDTTAQDAAAAGKEIAALDQSVAVLCMGDGTARRTLRAPGWLDERAEEFDAAVTAAFRAGDGDALLGLDRALADDLLVAGRPAWQVLAGAAAGCGIEARIEYDDAPFGVQYTVATWRVTNR
jgi:hypothetical protein